MEVSTSRKGTPYVRAKLYTPRKTHWYVEYHVYDPIENRLVKKRFYKIAGETDAERRKVGEELVEEVNQFLYDGFVLQASKGQENLPAFQLNTSTLQAFDKAVRIKLQPISERARHNYRYYYRILREWLKESGHSRKPISRINQAIMLDYFLYLQEEKKHANRTLNNHLEFIRETFSIMVRQELIHKNPLTGVKKWRTGSAKNIPFLPEEQKHLENYLRKTNLPLYYFTRFIYYGFMRPVEICRMRVNHIDLKRQIILVRTGTSKNNRQMPVVITTNLLPSLEEMNLRQYPGNYHLFSKGLVPGEKEIWRNRVSEMHAKALKATDLYNGELCLYSWKHTGNVNAYLAGVDIKSIQSQNRHHSLEMTEIYLKSLGLRISKDLKTKEW